MYGWSARMNTCLEGTHPCRKHGTSTAMRGLTADLLSRVKGLLKSGPLGPMKPSPFGPSMKCSSCGDESHQSRVGRLIEHQRFINSCPMCERSYPVHDSADDTAVEYIPTVEPDEPRTLGAVDR